MKCLGAIYFLLQSSMCLGCVQIATEQYNVTAANQWEVYKGAIHAGLASTNGIFDYTAPKQIRSWLGVMAAAYTSMAWTQKSSLDFFARVGESSNNRRCGAVSSDQQNMLENHALEAFTYAYLWSIQYFVPEWSFAIDSYANSIGADLTRCSISTCDISSAVGFAKKIVEDVQDVFYVDGWNAEGSTQVYNPFPFEDWRPPFYQPNFGQQCLAQWKVQNELCNLRIEYGDKVCWREQLNQMPNKDYFYVEKYHLPHMADSGRSYFLGNDFICDEISVQYPCYDLEEEANKVLDRSAKLNDEKKAKVEYFDNSFLWFNDFLTENFDTDFASTQWEIIRDITSITAAMYESTLVIWKQKKDKGIVRPRDFINIEFSGLPVEAYRGPVLKDVGQINAEEWIPYLKDEPTPEYPSYKACLCSVLSSGMSSLAGANIRGDGTEVSVTRAAGSSSIEIGKPDDEQNFRFTQWNEFEMMCFESRLNSGSHFAKSVTDAKTICSGLTSNVLGSFLELSTGIVPEFTIDYTFLPLQYRRCETRSDNILDTFGISTGSTPLSFTITLPQRSERLPETEKTGSRIYSDGKDQNENKNLRGDRVDGKKNRARRDIP